MDKGTAAAEVSSPKPGADETVGWREDPTYSTSSGNGKWQRGGAGVIYSSTGFSGNGYRHNLTSQPTTRPFAAWTEDVGIVRSPLGRVRVFRTFGAAAEAAEALVRGGGLEQADSAGLESAFVPIGSGNSGPLVAADEVTRVLTGAMHALRSYQHGNAAPDLAARTADACEALLARLGQAQVGGAPRDTQDAIASLQALHAGLALAGFAPIGSSKRGADGV